jgi:hypothetical protein
LKTIPASLEPVLPLMFLMVLLQLLAIPLRVMQQQRMVAESLLAHRTGLSR